MQSNCLLVYEEECTAKFTPIEWENRPKDSNAGQYVEGLH